MTSGDWKKEFTEDIKKIEFALRHPKYANFKVNNRLQLIKFLRKLNKLWPYFFTSAFIFECQHAFKVTPIIFDDRVEPEIKIEKINKNILDYPYELIFEDLKKEGKESLGENILWTGFYFISFFYSGYLLSLWYSTRYGEAIEGRLTAEMNYALEYQKEQYELLKELLEIKKNDLQLFENNGEVEKEFSLKRRNSDE